MENKKEKSLLRLGTRKSPLALAQVEEILAALRKVSPGVRMKIVPIDTVGDKDKKTPISEMEGTDFFTREIDQALLRGKIDCAVHSAKDLPDVIPQGIEIAAVTVSVDPYDVLVSKSGLKLKQLPKGARVGTSSERRKSQLLKFCPDLKLVDIRGTMQERLGQLKSRRLDAVVIAGAGLIRLGLGGHITEKIDLKVLTPHPLQGSLAVTVRKGDQAMKRLFSNLNRKKIAAYPAMPRIKKILFTGTNAESFKKFGKIVPVPMIAIKPVKKNGLIDAAIEKMAFDTGVIFTSRHAVRYFLGRLIKKTKSVKSLKGKEIIAIGKATAEALARHRIQATKIAKEESAEGIIKMLRRTSLKGKRYLIPRSDLANDRIVYALRSSGARVDTVTVYRNVPAKSPKRDLREFDEIFFTSPSTVKNFMEQYKTLPGHILVKAIGPVTRRCLKTFGIKAEILYGT